MLSLVHVYLIPSLCKGQELFPIADGRMEDLLGALWRDCFCINYQLCPTDHFPKQT